ncbi:MAG: helix-turn-helix domain-containing protein [Dehalococcoidia bacterium]|nr:helix-turn-helix domain-containing protein [Dehalococcoidia bacterium]
MTEPTTYSVNEAAQKLNVCTRTIRRHIKSGKLKAELVKGSFGDEYRILSLPSQLDGVAESEKERALDRTAVDKATSLHVAESMDIIRELQEKNLALAAQLGAAAERIRALEGQVKLLEAPKEAGAAHLPWWRRLFAKK